MWSRLTEYAAEIVAPPSEDGDHDGDTRVGDEIWSRFTNIVAPTGDDNVKAEEEEEEYDKEDDQERYISELERALLQKKKQNERLEERIRELEANASTGGEQGSEPSAATIEKNKDVARLEKELETLRRTTAAENAARNANEAARDTANVEDIAALQKRISELEVHCGVLEATLREERAVTGNDASSMNAERTPPPPSLFPTLVQAALTLSKTIPVAENKSFVVGTTDTAIAAQLLELAESTRQRIEHSEAQVTKLHAALVSFFKLQNLAVSCDGDSLYSDVQSKLGLISHRLSKGESDVRDIEHLQQQLKAGKEREEKHQKSISALQTQLSGVQASKVKKDASVASRESERLAEVEKRDRVISNLHASEDQLKHALEQLGRELEDAHAETDEFEKICKTQQVELKKLQRRSEQASELEATIEELQVRMRELETSAQEYEQGYVELLQEAETLKKQTEEEKEMLVATTEAHMTSAEQQVLYELQARLSACEADKLVAVQDADRLQNELDALDKVLLHFRADHKQQRERLLQLEQQLEDARRSSPAKTGSFNSSGSISEEDFRRVMDVLAKRTQECDQLRETLENVAKRFSSETVVDKQLAAQLVVSYLESDKKHEVLQLMARMMGFTDEQKQRAGIHSDGHVVIPGNGGGGLFSSMFGVQSASAQNQDDIVGSGESAQGSGPQDKHINELWSNFLIDEAKR